MKIKTKQILQKKEQFRFLKKFLFVGIFLISQLNIMAQQIPVRGTVTDSKTGGMLPGVNVTIQGTTIGTITDANGSFTLNVPSENSVLQFLYRSATEFYCRQSESY